MTEKRQALYDIFGFSSNRVDYLINISNKYKYIYFETPKVGCSTIKLTLQKLEVDDLSNIPEDVHNKGLSPLLSPLKLEKKFTEYLTDEYFKFSFVRNPYTRILSCYLDKIVGSQKDVILPQLGFKPTDVLSFMDFLQAVKKQSYAEMNVHWKPQSILLASENITLDFIGRQENFDNDLQQVLSKITKKDSDSLHISNERPHAVGANKKLQTYITQDTVELILDIYHDDFELYGYSRDPFDTNPLPEIVIKKNQQLQKKDLASIIIPCYNQAQYLEEAVQSVIEQTYPNIEIIIIDDGSPDNTQEVAIKLQKKYPEKIQLISQENSGLYAARNSGIKKSSGIYIVPLDADDKLHKKMLSTCIQMIQESNSDIAYTGYQGFGMSNRINMWKAFEETNPLYLTPCSATALFKKKVWDITGGYKHSMNDGYEDWEFWVNAYKHNFKFKHIPEKLFFYRIKEESMYLSVYKNDAYLKAKIVMIHPELYPTFRVQRSIDIIKEHDKLPNFYFYYSEQFSINDANLISTINNDLSSCVINEEKIITPDNKNFVLYELDSLNNIQEIEQLIKDSNEKLVFFYSSIRYQVPKLKNYNFALNKSKEIVKTKGNLFPYVFMSKRKDPTLQSIACERLERFEAFNQNRIRNFLHNSEILNKKLAFQEEEHNIEMDMTNKKFSNLHHKYSFLMELLSDITKASTLKSPIQKISAYKKLLALYHQYKR